MSNHFYSDCEGSQHLNFEWSGIVEGLMVYFIDPQHPDKLSDRNSVYCQPDDFKRFTYFSQASLEFMVQFGKNPNIIDWHDWPVAVVLSNFAQPQCYFFSRDTSAIVVHW